MNEYNTENLQAEIRELRSDNGYLYAGLPKFKALFGRDSIISSLQLLSYDSKIAVSTIRALSALQGKKIEKSRGEFPGKILHEYYDSEPAFLERKKAIPWLTRDPSYFSVDSTPLFMILLAKVISGSDPKEKGEFIRSYVSAIKFIIDYGISDTFLGYEKAVIGGGIQSQSWRDGIGDILDRLKSPVYTIGVQGYVFEALSEAEPILRNSTDYIDEELIQRVREASFRIRENIVENFWIEDSSYFALATDGDGVGERSITSDPGHLLLSGILSRKYEEDVVERLFDTDMITDFGIRSLSTMNPGFDEKAYQRGSIWPQDNWLIAMGLKKRGYSARYKDLRGRLLYAYEKLGKMPEYFGVKKNGAIMEMSELRIRPCYPQAWSTGAILSLIENTG